MLDQIFQFQNPFKENPNFNMPEDNFIENSISSGIEKALGNIGSRILHSGQLKMENFVHNLPQLVSVSLVAYLVFLGYKSFIKHETPDFTKIYTSIMIYTIFKLFWKVVLHI